MIPIVNGSILIDEKWDVGIDSSITTSVFAALPRNDDGLASIPLTKAWLSNR